jgi:signal transduction histidine kinase
LPQNSLKFTVKIFITISIFCFPFYSFCQKTIEENQLQNLYSLATKSNEKDLIAIQNRMAVLLNHSNLLDSSLKMSNEALNAAKIQKNPSEQAKSEMNIANILQKRGRYFEATTHYESAIKLALNDSLLAMTYHYLGTCYKDEGMLDRTIEMQIKALQVVKNKNLWSIESKCWNTIALTHMRNPREYNRALPLFYRALALATKAKDLNMIAIVHKSIGKVLLFKEPHNQTFNEKLGLNHLQQAIEIQEKSNSILIHQSALYSYLVLVKYYYDTENYNLSITYLNKASALAEKAQWVEELSGCEDWYYRNYKALGNYQQSLFHFEKYRNYVEKLNGDKILSQRTMIDAKLRNSLLENENILKNQQRNWLIISLLFISVVAFLIFRLYNTVKKQNLVIEKINGSLEEKVQLRTLELQQAYNEIKEAMLKGQTIERKRVAAELHDNLGSLFSAIQMSLDVVDASHLTKKEQFIFKNIQNQLEDAYREVRLLSHNLQPAELEKEGLEKALLRLAEKINMTCKIKISLDLAALIPLSKEIEFNLYSICLELTNNILKHSEGSKAHISFIQIANNQLLMVVKDNGRGIDLHDKRGFGLQNIEHRLEQIGGEMSMKFDDGTVYEILVQC